MKPSRLFLLLLAVAVIAGLTACDSDDGDDILPKLGGDRNRPTLIRGGLGGWTGKITDRPQAVLVLREPLRFGTCVQRPTQGDSS